VEAIELLVSNSSSSFNIDDKYLKWVLICNFYKRLILNLRGQEVITCSQILNSTLTIISCAQIKLWTMTMPNCTINMYVQANHTKILTTWIFTLRITQAAISLKFVMIGNNDAKQYRLQYLQSCNYQGQGKHPTLFSMAPLREQRLAYVSGG